MSARHLVAAIPTPCSGPGWSNTPIVLLWVEGGVYSTEWVQPEDQPDEARVLYSVTSTAIGQMTRIMALQRGVRSWG